MVNLEQLVTENVTIPNSGSLLKEDLEAGTPHTDTIPKQISLSRKKWLWIVCTALIGRHMKVSALALFGSIQFLEGGRKKI